MGCTTCAKCDRRSDGTEKGARERSKRPVGRIGLAVSGFQGASSPVTSPMVEREKW